MIGWGYFFQVPGLGHQDSGTGIQVQVQVQDLCHLSSVIDSTLWPSSPPALWSSKLLSSVIDAVLYSALHSALNAVLNSVLHPAPSLLLLDPLPHLLGPGGRFFGVLHGFGEFGEDEFGAEGARALELRA